MKPLSFLRHGAFPSCSMKSIETQRLLLRTWRDADRVPLARLNSDPKVMRYFPALMSLEESNALFERMRELTAANGYGPMAVELKETGSFLGLIGLGAPSFQAHFTPCVEIAWRLHPEFWGNGYATEGAQAVIQRGFAEWGLQEIFAFTAVANQRSIAVMKRLGMKPHIQRTFEHPRLAENDPLKTHALFHIRSNALRP